MGRSDFSSWLQQFCDPQLRRFWVLSGVSIFSHTVADPALTYLAVRVYDIGYETNPMLAAPLGESLESFVVIHSPVWAISIGTLVGFAILFERSVTDELEAIAYYGELVWAGIILWGTVLVGNNLLVLWAAIN